MIKKRTTFSLLALMAAAVIPAVSHAAEAEFPNGTFNSAISGWYWEDWSNNNPERPDDVLSFDAGVNGPGGAVGSGSLKWVANFISHDGWQESVITTQLAAPENIGEKYGAISFDIKVDPSSTLTVNGDYAMVQVILRNNWDWKQQFPWITLDTTEWRRVTIPLEQGEAGGPPQLPIDAINAVTLRIASGVMAGPITVNIDNIAWVEETVIWNGNGSPLDPNFVPSWSWENWSQAGSMVSWSPVDKDGREHSGSLRLENAFTGGGYQQAVYTFVLPATVDAGVEYSHINLDVKVDPQSTARSAGDYGFFEIILRNGPNWDWVPTGPAETTGTRLNGTEWQHISMPVRSGDRVHRITLKLGENDLPGPVILYVDNITWTENTAPPPPPELSIEKAEGGLNLVATSTDQYGRQNIYSADGLELGWIDSAEPVTYSFTLTDFPANESNSGFQAHMFLVPGFPGTGSAPDWTEPTMLFLDLRAGNDGTGNAVLRWKQDQPNGNSQLYAAGLPTRSSSSILGTWSITAQSNTELVITAPDGSTTPVTLPDALAAAFAGTVRMYVGIQPNNPGNIGEGARIGEVKVTRGNAVLVEDDFSGEVLDESKWVANGSAGAVQLIPAAEAGYFLTWTLPDSGFSIEWTPSLTNPSWTVIEAVPYGTGALLRQVHIPASALPSQSQGYFRMFRPEAP